MVVQAVRFLCLAVQTVQVGLNALGMVIVTSLLENAFVTLTGVANHAGS
jgi:hypothetical protein